MSEENPDSDPTHCPSLVAANIYFLGQAADIMGILDPEAYTRTDTRYFESGLGKHFRHVLDHYTVFLDGLAEGGRIDYDARERNPRLESDPVHARNVTLTCISRLEELEAQGMAAMEGSSDGEVPGGTYALEVCSNASAGDTGEAWAPSTLRRELQFLISHTVHHFALIAMILRLQGHNPPADFGVAPSTLEYQQR